MLSLCFLIFPLLLSSSSSSSAALSSRIIGGQNAIAGEFPFAAAIQIQKDDGKYFCGGALIHRQWILTSAHCADSYKTFTITLGSIKRQDDKATVVSSGYAIKHRDFDPAGYKADIALILLHMPLILSDYLKTINLADHVLTPERQTLVIGWGETSDSSSSFAEVLNYVTVVALNNTECRAIYGDVIDDNVVCAVGNFNEGICTGDAGGPLIQYVNGVAFHVGVASFQSQNGCENSDPSGFTRTFAYVDWIRSFVV